MDIAAKWLAIGVEITQASRLSGDIAQ